jgi:hypothetical protein
MDNLNLRDEIEGLFRRGKDNEALELVGRLDLRVQLRWETKYNVFREGLSRANWWEVLFSNTHPVTHARLKKSAGRRSNAAELISQIRLESTVPPNLWRSLLVLVEENDRNDKGIWFAGAGWQTSIQVADEFGVDRVHFANGTDVRSLDLCREGKKHSTTAMAGPALLSLGMNRKLVMRVSGLWSVPFQNACIVEFESMDSHEKELVWVPTGKTSKSDFDVSLWAINHNSVAENPDAFAAPPFLLGDRSLGISPPLVAGTEGRTDINAKTAIVSVTMRKRDTLVFDQVKQLDAMPKNWRHVLTEELFEPKQIPITCACFVLDAFLLYGSQDGVLRAHPRGNLKSVYHVEEFHSTITHLVSLFNVVAVVCSFNILEVRRVEKTEYDPFLKFELLFGVEGVNTDSRPLLYGPFVLYELLDGTWHRATYDASNKESEIINIPVKEGYALVSVKNANWRYWTVVLRNLKTGLFEDYLLFNGHGGQHHSKPFLVATCIDCGVKASRLCGKCKNIGFCSEHGDENGHSKRCGRK